MKAVTKMCAQTITRGLGLKNRIVDTPVMRSKAPVSDAAHSAPDAALFDITGSPGDIDYPMLGAEAFVGALAALGHVD